MKTNEYFERVFCINPPEEVKRWNKVRSQCLTQGIQVERVDKVVPEVLPPRTTFSPDQLAELITFYKLVRKANIDRVGRFLVLGDRIKLRSGFKDQMTRVLEQMPSEWDLLYLGWEDSQPKLPHPKKDKVIQEVFWANGCYALGISNRFYHIFLETAKVPLYNLDEHIKSISLPLSIYVAEPSLVTKA